MTPELSSSTDDLSCEEILEVYALMLECAEKLGARDAQEGVTVPPAEFCISTRASERLRQAWLLGFRSANGKLIHE